MKQPLIWHRCYPRNLRADERGSVRTILLVVVFFVLGLVVSALWFRPPGKPPAAAEAPVELSDSTKAVVAQVSQPIEIRFYSLLDPSAPASLNAFSEHIEQLLSAYQQQANGKIQVNRFDARTNASPNAALADGIKGFNLDKGEGCYLGLALACNGKKETLAQLAPEWEPALEADISRAILRLTEAAPPNNAALTGPKSDIAAGEEVKQRIPNYASVSLEEGTRILREAALKEFASTVNQMQTELQEAQQHLEQARNAGSAPEQESAVKHLQDVQKAQSEKLREVAARSQSLIATLQQLKAGNK
jgi:ABC transporter family protein